MNLWLLIVMLLALVGVTCLLFYLGYTTSKNITQSGLSQIRSFAARVDPTNIQASFQNPLTGVNGLGETVNQITCPAGTSVNIIGAIADVYDPTGQCTNNPSDQIVAMCNPDIAVGKCSSNADCFDNSWFCNTSGQCQLKTNQPQQPLNPNDCVNGPNHMCVLQQGDCTFTPDAKTGACIDPNICYNTNPNGQSTVCSPGSGKNCASRDASAYIASKCNGQQTCSVSMADFGPTPCSVGFNNVELPSSLAGANGYYQSLAQYRDDSTYLGLPMTYGWQNGNLYPDNSSGQYQTTPTVNIGYTVHGIYTCVPNNE